MPDPHGRLAADLERLAGVAVRELVAIGGGHGARHYRAVLADGRELFIKTAVPGQAGATAAALTAEAHGLRWLAEAAGAPVPEIIFESENWLACSWLRQGSPDPASAEQFGRDLARLHGTGADSFGAPWPGFIASLPLPNDEEHSWPSWYARCRLLPYWRIGRDAGALGSGDVALIEAAADRIGEVTGPAEPPSRIHGDCWTGNVLWSQGRGSPGGDPPALPFRGTTPGTPGSPGPRRAWLIDPAAHGGHRETDLAMLALFGAPYLDRTLAAYREAAPLANGWRARVPLHQLHPLLVHVCLFGSGYREAALSAARSVLAA